MWHSLLGFILPRKRELFQIFQSLTKKLLVQVHQNREEIVFSMWEVSFCILGHQCPLVLCMRHPIFFFFVSAAFYPITPLLFICFISVPRCTPSDPTDLIPSSIPSRVSPLSHSESASLTLDYCLI